MDIEDNLHVFVFTLTLSSGSKSVLFLYLIIQKPSKSAVKHTLSLWNVHIHSRMLCLYYPTHCEVTLLVWVVSRLMFLKVALFMKGKLWFSKRTAFCLFVITVKNLREGFFFFFQKREENCWKEVSTIAITVLPNRKADCKVIKWGYHKPEERGPLSISEKKGLLNIVLTFSLYVVDGAINRLPLSMSNEVILDKELFIKVSAFKHFLKPHTRPPSKTKENRVLHSWHF